MTIFIFILLMVVGPVVGIIAGNLIGNWYEDRREARSATPEWVSRIEALTDGGMPALNALHSITNAEMKHPKDARCRRTGGGCYISRTR